MANQCRVRAMLLACLLLPAIGWACTGGLVFDDVDGDGVRQPGERGLPGVRVSNGREIVYSDADGAWRGLPPRAGGAVFVVKPPGCRRSGAIRRKRRRTEAATSRFARRTRAPLG